ncbi:hypothetical protein BB8028_0002g05640 [Beauveria bassiana]|uniref:Uncharacterized protein n=1 Tax=Beauveria bassiana TaxID=176275 RepID=A0A2S7Y252_BEABA|nr:hypothetical protein BB8028_0002g05640 [Beauveria bassiana]
MHLHSPSVSSRTKTSTTTRPDKIATSSWRFCPRPTAKSLVTWALRVCMSLPELRGSSTCIGSPTFRTGSGSRVCRCRHVPCTTSSC